MNPIGVGFIDFHTDIPHVANCPTVDGSEILHHLGWGWLKLPINNRIIIILGGAGFQPSTVSFLNQNVSGELGETSEDPKLHHLGDFYNPAGTGRGII